MILNRKEGDKEMSVTEIKAYKASDDKIFEDEQEAKKYDSSLILRDKIEKFVDGYGHDGMDKRYIEEMIIDNKDELLDILKEK
jgi:hypothetical protein